MIDLTAFIRPGDGVWWSQTSAEPTPLVHALIDQVDAIGGVRAFVGMSWNERLIDAPDSLDVASYGALGALRGLSRAGRLTVVPTNYSALPDLFAKGALPCDVGFVQVSAPDEDGRYSLGVGVDYIADAVPHTRTLIAEVNRRMPATRGSLRLRRSRFAAVLETDRPLLELPDVAASSVDARIARIVAELVADGDTLQIGVGGLPTAVLAALRNHRALGVHSGMISDGILDLMDAGVVTGERKEIDAGIVVTGAALGSRRLYERVAELPIEFRPASYTHAAANLGRLRRLVSINSAVDVDLTGQVNAEVRGGVYIGAIGGHSDFSHAASSTGARSIIALRATSRGRSTILPTITTVTTARTDVDVVVTEFGAASLRGCTLDERAARLIAIAAPEFRAELSAARMVDAAVTA